MDLKEFAAQYSAILVAECSDNWLRGDIAIAVTELYNKDKEEHGKSKIIDEFLTMTGEARSTFSQYRWVASTFEDDLIRKLPVTWTHYRVCAAADNPEEWLKKAHDNKWSCGKLIEEIKSVKLDKDIDNGLVCSLCNKSITKEDAVSITYKRKRAVLCSLLCAQEHIQNLKSQ